MPVDGGRGENSTRASADGRYAALRVRFLRWRFDKGVALAKRVCRGNRYGTHTPAWPAQQPLGGPCLCSRVRRRLDFIPF